MANGGAMGSYGKAHPPPSITHTMRRVLPLPPLCGNHFHIPPMQQQQQHPLSMLVLSHPCLNMSASSCVCVCVCVPWAIKTLSAGSSRNVAVFLSLHFCYGCRFVFFLSTNSILVLHTCLFFFRRASLCALLTAALSADLALPITHAIAHPQ